MRKIVSHLILTLDGVAVFDAVADTIVRLRDTEEVLSDFFSRLAEEDAMLLGRVTYEDWRDYWPGSTVEPFSSHIARVPKYVVSRSLEEVRWGSDANANVSLIDGDLAHALDGLRRQPGGTIGVHGSPTLVESLLHQGLLDELRLEIYPVVAGSGARLFRTGRPPRELRLMASRVTSNGVAILSYQPVAAPE